MCTRNRHLSVPLVMLGAKYLSVLKSLEYNQELWIFGESHTIYSEDTCKVKPNTTLIEYLTTLLIGSSDVVNDVFVEISYHRGFSQLRSQTSVSSQIDIVLNLINPCYTSDVKCPFDVRLHYVNTRTGRTLNYKLDFLNPIRDELSDYWINPDKLPVDSSIIDRLKTFIVETNKQFDTVCSVEDFFHIGPNDKIDIEISRIDDKFEFERIKLKSLYDSAKSNILSIYKIIGKLNIDSDAFMLNQTSDTINKLYESLKDFNGAYFDNEVLLTDIYTLARIFHHFENPTGNQGSTVKRGIFYGGGSHARNIVEYLKSSGYIETFIAADDSGCISVPNV